MKRTTILFIILIALMAFSVSAIQAQMPGVNVPADDHTTREEAEGKEVWERLQDKKATCAELAAEDYEALGEYFMGKILGASHSFMNQMMMQKMGEEGEEKMHEVMGRRMSGCNTDAAFPNEGADFMPMMNMMLAPYTPPQADGAGRGGMMGGRQGMMGGWYPSLDQEKRDASNPLSNKNNFFTSMMGFGYPMGFGGGLFMILWWILIIVAIVALVRWLMNQGKGSERGRALEILKERYAKGEITKDEFEKMKRDIE